MKKLVLFTMIVLIFGTISPSLTNSAYAQNDPSILLRIAIQADTQIVNQLNGVYGNETPNNIKILYEKGHLAVESLNESLSNDDIEKAKQDFLLAMNSFMQISRTISQSSEKVVVITSEKSNRSISSEIDRLEKYVKSLENISKKYDINAASDFIKIHDLIRELREQTTDLNEINAGIKKIKVILDSIKNDIRESASKHKSDFIKRFFDRLIEKIDKQLIIAQNEGVIDQIQIDKAHTLILEIKELLSKNQINDAKVVYVELKALMENIGHSIRIK